MKAISKLKNKRGCLDTSRLPSFLHFHNLSFFLFRVYILIFKIPYYSKAQKKNQTGQRIASVCAPMNRPM